MAVKPALSQRPPEPELEDLRDDCIAIVINSKLTFKKVHEQGGPTPQTTSKWLYRETRFPRLSTIRSMLNACDHDLTITPIGEQIHRYGYDGIEYPRTTLGQRKAAERKANRRRIKK